MDVHRVVLFEEQVFKTDEKYRHLIKSHNCTINRKQWIIIALCDIQI